MKVHSLSVWFEKNDLQNRPESHDLDIHINHWKLRRRFFSRVSWQAVATGLKSIVKLRPKKTACQTLLKCDIRYDYFVDIGLLLPNLTNIDKIHLYLPFEISEHEIIDLGSFFSNHINLIKAVFNEDYNNLHQPQPKILPIEFVKKGIINIYLLDVKNDIRIRYDYGGTVLDIDLSEIQCKRTEPFYFRLRLQSPQVHNFSTTYKLKNSLFESAFTNTEVIDFRINEKRGLDKTLLQKIENNIAANIKKIHFFLLRNAKDDYIFSHKAMISCRELEDDMWQDYLGSGYQQDKVLAYHWKESDSEGKIESFNALIKMKFEKYNLLTILFYLAVITILSISWNLAASYIFKHLDRDSQKQEQKIAPAKSQSLPQQKPHETARRNSR